MGKSWDTYRLGEPHDPPRHKGLKAFAIVAALMAITILPAMAAKGGNGAAGGSKGGHGGGGSTTGSGTIVLRMVTDANNDGPNWGDQITYDISQNATTEPRVETLCYQNKEMVLDAVTGFYDSYPFPWTQIIDLRSQKWTGGAADCTAQLYSWNGWSRTTIGTTSFHVNA
jgi:hypothetical protein